MPLFSWEPSPQGVPLFPPDPRFQGRHRLRFSAALVLATLVDNCIYDLATNYKQNNDEEFDISPL